VFPVPLVFGLLVGSIGLSWWLVPRQDELVERLFMDKQYERIANLLRQGLGAGSEAEIGKLRHLSAEQLTALSHLLRLTPREQLRSIFSGTRPPAYDSFVHGLVLNAVRYVDVIPPADAWTMVEPHLHRMSGTQQSQICGLLSQNAFAVKDSALAASILLRSAKAEGATWAAARDMARAFRWSERPGQGGKELRQWFERESGRLSEQEKGEAREMIATLALEGGEPSLAFDVCLDELNALAKDAVIPVSTMERALSLADQSSRTEDLTPWLERFVSTLPESRMDFATLRKLSKTDAPSQKTYRHWAGWLAKLCDWHSRFDEGFDQHSRLAALGDLQSLDRVLALADFLGRDQEVADLLRVLHPVRERPQTHIVFARLLASLGDDAGARPLYESWVTAHPADRDSAFELACLFEDMGDEEQAMRAFDDLVKRFPSDGPSIKKLAEARIRLGREQEALALYQSLRDEDHDPHTLENYAMLAESLDDREQLFRALQLTVKSAKQPTVELYLDLAEAATRLDDPRIQTEVLGDAIAKRPDSAALRVALANSWLKMDGYEEALAVLTGHDQMRGNLEAVALCLATAPYARDPEAVLKFVGQDVDRRFNLPAGARLDLAVLFRLCSEEEKSETMLKSVPESPATLRMIAEARHLMGDHDEAVRLMLAHLTHNVRATPAEWVFLGEIYEEMGRLEDARKAYDYSLALLTADLPDTAFTQPRDSGAAATP
jgi:tetratricopeptide (TPR) repeat protein